MKKKPLHPRWMTWVHEYKGGMLAPTDAAILHFLWKWKLATARVLYLAVGQGHKPNSFNKRLKKLERNELITAVFDFPSGYWTWELADFGFFAIRESLGPIKDHGFRSASHQHDRLVQVFQLGEWFWLSDANPVHRTDQELLRYPVDNWSSWVPDSSYHRPDGYTRVTIGGNTKLFAFEVELYAKSVSRYRSVIDWYRYQRSIENVLWLVGDPFVVCQIDKAKSEAYESSIRYHLFVALDDFLENGWDAVVTTERSEKVAHLREIMRGPEGLKCGNNVGNDGARERVTVLSDHRKFLQIQGPYTKAADRLAL